MHSHAAKVPPPLRQGGLPIVHLYGPTQRRGTYSCSMAGVEVDPGWHMGRVQREGWSWIPRYSFGSQRGKSKRFGTIISPTAWRKTGPHVTDSLSHCRGSLGREIPTHPQPRHDAKHRARSKCGVQPDLRCSSAGISQKEVNKEAIGLTTHQARG